MSRLALLALLVACGNGSKSASGQQKGPDNGGQATEKIAVPGAGDAPGGGAPTGEPPAAAGDAGSAGISPGAMARAQNPAFHLRPEEGTLTVARLEGKVGAAGAAEIKLEPATGYKIATDFPIKLQLEAPAGVKLEKTSWTAGGRAKAQGDAAALSEHGLSFAVTATPEAAGSYEIKGVFQFGVCEKDSCHPRTQPITIQVAAN